MTFLRALTAVNYVMWRSKETSEIAVFSHEFIGRESRLPLCYNMLNANFLTNLEIDLA